MSLVTMFRHEDRILLGADSRATSAEEAALTLLPGRARTKIQTHGRWTLATVGFASGPGCADVRAAIGAALVTATTLDDAVQAARQCFIATLLPSLKKAAAYPKFAELFACVDGGILECLFAGQQHGELVLGSFGANYDPALGQARMFGGALPPTITHLALGQQYAADLVAAKPRPAWLQRGDAAAAHRLLREQARATPAFVSGPFTVVEVTRHGRREIAA
jgi:hypothetical protein